MAVVNDFPGLYEKIRAYADGMARSMGIDPKAIYAFFNERGGHFPQTLQELNAFLDTPDPTYGYARRDPSTGALRFIGGGQPTPGLTPEQRGGFAGHFQNNAGDFDIQRFQQVDPRGVPWGGSWDPQFNTAHPELRGSGFDTPLGASLGLGTALSPGPTAGMPAATGPRTGGRGAQGMEAQAFDANNYVADVGDAFVSVVNGQVNRFEKAILGSQAQAMAEQDYNARSGSASSAPAPSGSTAPPASSAPSGGGSSAPSSSGSYPSTSSSSGSVTINPATLDAANTGVNNAAMIAYYNARLALDRDIEAHRDENEKHRIALEAARDAANKAARDFEISGYAPGAGAEGNGQKVLDAIAALRSDPAYQAADGNGRRQMEAARVMQATGGTLTLEQALAAVEQMRQTSAAAGGAPSNAAQIEGILNSVAPGRSSVDERRRQDTATNQALTLLANLRGPENAFAYANTLANLPASMRANIAAATARLPMSAQNPAMRGFMSDVGWGGQGAATGGTGAESATGAVPPAAGPRTGAGTATYAPAGEGGMMYNQQAPAAQPGAPANTADDAAMAAYRAAVARQAQTGTEQYYLQPGTPQYAQAQAQFAGAPRIQAVPQGATAQTGATAPTAATAGTDAQRAALGAAMGAYGTAGGRPLGTDTAGGNQPAYGPRTTPTPPSSGEAFNPSAMSPTDYNRTDPYARKLMWAGFENSGGDIESGQWRYARSLPKAYGPRAGRLRAA